MSLKESDLYNPLKIYLENQGYSIGAEVKECDLVAIKGDEMILIELKTRVSVALLIQAARRKDISESVYIAVPVPQGKKDLPNSRGLKNLLRKLEVGLILVRFMKTKTRVDMVLHPKPYEKRMRPGKHNSILREVNGRYGEFNKGGIPTTEERITAYRQESIRLAVLLKKQGEASPAWLRKLSARPDKVQPILSQNLYGWFDRVKRGVYSLNPVGLTALERYERDFPDLISLFNDQQLPFS
jgi:hypothetical protein